VISFFVLLLIDLLIERLVAEGKLTPEELAARIEEQRAQQPPSETEALK
jgi:hypothetical protein